MQDESSHSAPPMSAFQGLIFARRRRPKKKATAGLGMRSPIDPMDNLGIEREDDTNSELTEDDSSTEIQSKPYLLDNQKLKWSSGDMGLWEQACFVSLCCIFFDPLNPNPIQPHRVVVTGLWGNVILVHLLEEKSHITPQLVAEDIWDNLRNMHLYVSEDDQNIVKIIHPIYREYGLKLSERYHVKTWKLRFALFLQDSLASDQPHEIQVYAAQTLVYFWIRLGEVSRAAALLHQPSFICQEWALLSKQKNPLQVTAHHVQQVEQYLNLLPASPTKWQEALGLYQGWHTLLQQQMQIDIDQATDSISVNSHASSGSKASSKRSSTKRSYRRCDKKKRGDPLQMLITGKALYVLSQSLDSILTELPGEDAAINVLWKRQAEYLVEALDVWSDVDDIQDGVLPLREIKYLLSATAWMSISSCCATVEESKIDDLVNIDNLIEMYGSGESSLGETNELKCLSVANTLLAVAEPSKKSSTLQLLYFSLRAELQDAFGRWLYNKQQFHEARVPLEDASKLRRHVLSLLKDSHPDSTSFFWWGSAPVNDSAVECEEAYAALCLNMLDTDSQVQQIEIALAQSLEYAALALHACDLSMAAMSWLHEALILKAGHLGKMSLEVARLNAAMAIVNEDLLQWESSLSRYRECLRIRMFVLSQKSPNAWFTSEILLFRSILETLSSLGNIYRMLGDYESAIGCYWKIATMTSKEWENLKMFSNKVGFWGFEAHRRMAMEFRSSPLPIIVLEEVRYSRNPLQISPSQHPPPLTRKDVFEAENSILSQSAQAFQTILNLSEQKNRSNIKCNVGNISEEDAPLLLVSTYRLALIHMYFGDFRSAISSLENALNALWILDPSSSDSSSDEEDGQELTLAKQKSRKKLWKGVFGEEMQGIDDARIYHSLGICRAACGEYEKAIRFHLTALRCTRRLNGMDSMHASEILDDAATCYWYLKDYDKAEEFWSASYRIRLQKEHEDLNDSFCESTFPQDYITNFFSDGFYNARILYCIGASLCSLGRYTEQRTQECLDNAYEVFASAPVGHACVEKANCLFYLANVQVYKSRNDTNSLQDAISHLNRASSIYRNLGYITSNCPHEISPDIIVPSSVALHAHIRYTEAIISEFLGKLHLAMDLYNASLLLYRSLEDKQWGIYVASVLNALAKLHMQKISNYDNVPLANFEESLKLRIDCLGRDHEACGDTLYQMAKIHSTLGNTSTAMDMCNEAVRIQIIAEGSDGASVALILQMLASLHVKRGEFSSALEKLEASLSIRRKRLNLVDRATRVVSFWSSGDLADDYFTLSDEIDLSDHGGHIRKTLHDDLIKEEVGIAVVFHCMGNVNVSLGDYEKARECFEESLRVRRNHPAGHIMSPDGSIKLYVSDSLHNLGCLYELQRDYENSFRYFRTTLKIKYGLLPKAKDDNDSHVKADTLIAFNDMYSIEASFLNSRGSVSYAMTLHRLGSVSFRLGYCEAAVACLQSALKIQKHFLGLHHFVVSKTLVDLACVLRNSEGRNELARAYYKEAFEIRKLRSKRDANVGHVLYRLGQLYEFDNDYVNASNHYYSAIQYFAHRYLRNTVKQFCDKAFSIRKNAMIKDLTDGDILAKDGLKVLSIEETDDLNASHFAIIADALKESWRLRSKSSDTSIMLDLDVNSPDCLITFQLYLLSLFHYFQLKYREFHREVNGSTALALNRLGQIGLDGMRTSGEAMTFKMLYLIQE
jgi:tetratricopeptide (TPR) repeat protein